MAEDHLSPDSEVEHMPLKVTVPPDSALSHITWPLVQSMNCPSFLRL